MATTDERRRISLRALSYGSLHRGKESALKAAKKLRRRTRTLVAIVICLNGLLWLSALIFCLTIYLSINSLGDAAVTPTAVLQFISATVSISYVALHSVIARRHAHQELQQTQTTVQSQLNYTAIRVCVAACVLWLLTSGMDLIMAVRQMSCAPDSAGESLWPSQSTCIAHRVGTCFALLAFFDSICLFAILAEVRRPFEAHLFGYSDEHVDLSKCNEKHSHDSSSSLTLSGKGDACRIHPSRGSTTPNIFMLHSSSNTDVCIPKSMSPSANMGLGIFAPQAIRSPRRLSFVTSPVSSPRTSPTRSRSTDSTCTASVSCCSSLPPPQFRSSMIVTTNGVRLAAAIRRNSAVYKAVHPPRDNT